MKDKELDQILQHALTPTVSDEEIKVNYEMEGRPMMKKKNYFKPAVALVACAALVAGIGFGNLPDRTCPIKRTHLRRLRKHRIRRAALW